MSAHINEQGKFNSYYSLSIISPIVNLYDLYFLEKYINRLNKNIILVKNPTYIFFEVFSPTLFNARADHCPSIVKWYKEKDKKLYAYRFLYEESYRKKVDKTLELLENFYIEIINVDLEIVNFEIRLKLVFSNKCRKNIVEIKRILEKFWRVKRHFRDYIVIGYICDNKTILKPEEINQMKKLVPSKLLLHGAKYVNFWNRENYQIV
jgi:hypothetical protein